MREIERAGREAYVRDEEACGFLSGPADDTLLADQATELENLANKYHRVDPESHPRTGREYFKINGLKFERSLEEGQKTGRPREGGASFIRTWIAAPISARRTPRA